MKNIIFLFVFTFFTVSTFAQKSGEIKVIDPSAFKKEITTKKVQLVDVRTPKEYKEGHIKGAKNIDFFSEKFSRKFKKFDKNKPVYIYCRSGNRSAKAAVKLSEMGFSTIIDLEGGYNAWTSKEKK